MKIVSFCWLILIATVLQAQQITISGRVVDLETKEALPFASVGISGKPIGLITNEQGEFDFHIPSDLRNDILIVNMLGYRPYEVPVWSLISDRPALIEMQAASI